MKKLIVIFGLFFSVAVNAQDSEKIWFVKDFQVSIGFSNLAPNEGMMGDAHRKSFPEVTARIGIFHYNHFSVGMFGNVRNMKVKNRQYYGDFEKTTVRSIGPYVSYFQPISSKSLLEPYISYDYAYYNANFDRKKLSFESDGFGMGIDFEHKVSEKGYFVMGVKYTINKLRSETNPQWEKYLNNYNFFSVKMGFTFASNRL